ncbi:MAG: NAD-dependent epimerase/dehydratase family protein [Anaerolineae bacterium]|uniref:NAD-dependent epimerase/dehydratase family protein n=1 Tax=Candidatus Amarolinea dominans TaxID=3140696 RepID=UPI0031354C38|nr:NAD-dependent epimerase/dehydratase family protein [Anaerolineae bacterium]
MSTIAVTQAAAPLGLALLRLLDADPAVTRIVALDTQPPSLQSPKLKFFEADSQGPLRSGLEKYKVTRVVHLDLLCAAPTEAALRRHNVGGSVSFLTACLAAQTVEMAILLSSTLVYGGQPGDPIPVREDAPLRPHALPFAQHCQEIERQCQTYRDRYPQMKINVARLAPVTGAQPEHFVWQGLRTPAAALGQINPALQFVHVEDAARALHSLIGSDASDTYNIAADDSISLREAWQQLGTRPPGLGAALLQLAQRLPAGQLETWRSGWLAHNGKFKQAFDFTYRYTSAQALTTLAPTA